LRCASFGVLWIINRVLLDRQAGQHSTVAEGATVTALAVHELVAV